MGVLVLRSDPVPQHPRPQYGHTHSDVAAALGVSGSTLYRWRQQPDLNFPAPAEDGTWPTIEPVHDWYARHVAAKKSRLTPLDRDGDPNELINATEAAQVLGYEGKDPAATIRSYRGPRHGNYFPQPDIVDHDGPRWRRATIWAFGERRERHGGGRPGRSGRPRRPDPHLPAVRALLDANPDLTGAQVAEATGVHIRKAYRLLNEAKATR